MNSFIGIYTYSRIQICVYVQSVQVIYCSLKAMLPIASNVIEEQRRNVRVRETLPSAFPSDCTNAFFFLRKYVKYTPKL